MKVNNHHESERTLKEVISGYTNICWCPSTNNYPALFYLSELFQPYIQIDTAKLPNLFIISDIRPETDQGYYIPRLLGTSNWRSAERIYPEREKYNDDAEYKGLPFSVKVMEIERLKDLDFQACGTSMDASKFINSLGDSKFSKDPDFPVYSNGRVFYMHVLIESGEHSCETDLIYAFSDSFRFASEFLLEEGIEPEYVVLGAYNQGFDGLDSGFWFSRIIPMLRPQYLLTTREFVREDEDPCIGDYYYLPSKDEDMFAEEAVIMRRSLALYPQGKQVMEWFPYLGIHYGVDENIPWNLRSNICHMHLLTANSETYPDISKIHANEGTEFYRNGNHIRIRFDVLPGTAVREAMKSMSFRFDRNSHEWYAPATDENEKFACTLIN